MKKINREKQRTSEKEETCNWILSWLVVASNKALGISKDDYKAIA